MKQTILTITALLLAPLAAMNSGRTLPEIPIFGKLRADSFQSMETHSAMTSNDWN